tara:strand:+ start:4771 stop:4935 length:165 start_codon:yes stop_codon:yes gene_type:complete
MQRSHLVIHTPAQEPHANDNWRFYITQAFIKVSAILFSNMVLPLNRNLRQDGGI